MAFISSGTTIIDNGAFQASLGSLVHIKTLTASGDATLSFVDGTADVVLDSTYPIYKFEFINIHPQNDANFTFQGSTNTGSSYGVTITSTTFSAYNYETYPDGGLFYDGGSDLAQSTSFQRLHEISNNNDASSSGYLYIFNPSSTTFVKHWISTYSHNHDADGTGSGFARNGYMSGYFNDTNDIDAFQFKMSSGNIDSGKIKLYGIKDS